MAFLEVVGSGRDQPDCMCSKTKAKHSCKIFSFEELDLAELFSSDIGNKRMDYMALPSLQTSNYIIQMLLLHLLQGRSRVSKGIPSEIGQIIFTLLFSQIQKILAHQVSSTLKTLTHNLVYYYMVIIQSVLNLGDVM